LAQISPRTLQPTVYRPAADTSSLFLEKIYFKKILIYFSKKNPIFGKKSIFRKFYVQGIGWQPILSDFQKVHK
jgi:hypothetical protein